MAIKLDEDEGSRLPTAAASRIKMQPDIPKAKKVLENHGAVDLAEMLFGEDVA